jgi:hypothetical protein
MIDDSDVSDALRWVISIICLVIIAVLAFFAFQNGEECSKRHCDVGRPVLAHHECVCESLAK